MVVVMGGPMALKHDFFLLKQEELSNGKWLYLEDQMKVHTKNKTIIDDEIIRYLTDTMRWIPSYNPDRDEKIKGLCYWGNTIIYSEGAERFAEVLKGWIAIFSTADEFICLQGAWTWQEDQSNGDYEKINYNQNELIGQLKSLLNLVEKTIDGEGILLHMGI